MGRLTDEMTRLRGQIQSAEGARERLMNELKQFETDLHSDISKMLTDVHTTRFEMSKRTKADRLKFIDDLKKKLNHLRYETALKRQNFIEDCTGARRAYFCFKQTKSEVAFETPIKNE